MDFKDLQELIKDLKKEIEYIENSNYYNSPSNINIVNVQASKKEKDFIDIKIKKLDYLYKKLDFYNKQLMKYFF